MNKIKVKFSIFALLVAFGVSTCLNPIYPKEQLLQHLGTALLLSILVIDLKRNDLTLNSFTCLSIFIFFHILGARYIYSYVPYDEWINSLTNLNISLDGRNHYDRFVHLIFGFLAFPYLFEIIVKSKNISRNFSILLTWAIIQSISMLYELFEWLLTLILSSEAADNYNGQQGDIWDAQKDMALALLSSSIFAISIFLVVIKNERKRTTFENR